MRLLAYRCPNCRNVFQDDHCHVRPEPTIQSNVVICPKCSEEFPEPVKLPFRDNARFWEYVNDGWVKITLKPGQSLTHVRAGRHDEGWYRDELSFEHNDIGVVSVYVSDGTDCDGRITHATKTFCLLSKLKAKPAEPDKKDFPIPVPRPQWEQLSSRQRDYSAEAMNY